MSIWAPGTKRTPEGSGRRQTASRAQRDQKSAELGVARKSPSSSEHTDQSGGGGVDEWAWRIAACVKRCWVHRDAAAWKVAYLVVIP